ncbi:Hypothetical protein A7982_10828 [Minicystis rosea]|nr:Hypothetical protein A7982_10828 [Minicystis rosea]
MTDPEDIIPTFAEWVEHSFTDPLPMVPWDELPDTVVAGYLAELFEEPRAWADALSDERINKGLWFICGFDGYLRQARGPDVPKDLQIRWVRALRHLYRDLFAPRCTPDLGHMQVAGAVTGSPLNSICYMLWDLGQLEGAAMFPGSEHLVDPIFDVLTYALSLDSPACQESALHGLGHLKQYHRARVEGIIDAFIDQRPNLDVDLLAYARRARSGRVL